MGATEDCWRESQLFVAVYYKNSPDATRQSQNFGFRTFFIISITMTNLCFIVPERQYSLSRHLSSGICQKNVPCVLYVVPPSCIAIMTKNNGINSPSKFIIFVVSYKSCTIKIVPLSKNISIQTTRAKILCKSFTNLHSENKFSHPEEWTYNLNTNKMKLVTPTVSWLN